MDRGKEPEQRITEKEESRVREEVRRPSHSRLCGPGYGPHIVSARVKVVGRGGIGEVTLMPTKAGHEPVTGRGKSAS